MERYYAFGAFGLILLIYGLWRLVANLRFTARTTAVEGKFVDWEDAGAGKIGGPDSSKGRRSFRPIVAFRAADGSEHRVKGTTCRQSYARPDTPKGMPFAVRYSASNPADAHLVTLTDFWLFPVIALAMGIVCLAVAVYS